MDMPKTASLREWTALREHDERQTGARAIVIVDDDAAVLSSLGLMLRANGCRVRVYSGGAELLREPNPAESDILLVDYVMPEMDGLSLIRQLRQRGWGGTAILITGRYDVSLIARARAAGVAIVLEKPLAKEAILGALASLP
jgi:two-component system, LuxR family, response regulator FixJ